MMDKIYALMAKKDAWMASDEGATAVEYGLMVAGIAVVIIVAVFALGDILDGLFTDVGAQISEAGE